MIYFFIIAVSFIIVYLFTPNIRYVGIRMAAFDKKNSRKIHKKVITKLGGLAIYLGFLGGIVIACLFNSFFLKGNIGIIGGLLISSTLMLLLGIYDDFQEINPFIKLFTQFVVSLILVKVGFQLERIFIPGLVDFKLGVFSIPITILWLVGMMNAINFIDGLDGLASGIVAIFSVFLCIYGFLLKDLFIMYFSLALIGANIAFLKYNKYPAKIFMGDTGSLFLGCIISALAVYRPHQTADLSNILFFPSVLILFLPILDTSLAVGRRLLKKHKLFYPDSSHLHHYYLKLGFSHSQTVKRFYFITFCLGLVSFLLLLYGI